MPIRMAFCSYPHERNEGMKYQVFSENEWIYPDSPLTSPNTAEL